MKQRSLVVQSHTLLEPNETLGGRSQGRWGIVCLVLLRKGQVVEPEKKGKQRWGGSMEIRGGEAMVITKEEAQEGGRN